MNLRTQFSEAARASGRSLPEIVWEAIRLRTTGNRLGLSEYIDYQLYQRDLSWDHKKSFAGQRAQVVMEDILVDDYSKFLSLDKVTMYALFEGLGLPIPTLLATYRSLRPASSVRQLHTPDELKNFLAQAQGPIYIKRSFGGFGRGNAYVRGVKDGRVALGNNSEEDISEFVLGFDDGKSLGWVLQEPLANHPSITALTGSEKISGIRFHTFLSPTNAVPTKAIFKINLGMRDTDNFEHGASGNMVGAIDLASGRVTRVVSGIGLHQVVNPVHPVTGREIVGFTIPYWCETLDLVVEGQKAFPGFLCPGWDVAICADGPKIMEVNAFGDIDLSQHAHRTSFLDEQFMGLLKARQLDSLMSANPQAGKRSPANDRLGIRRHHWQW